MSADPSTDELLGWAIHTVLAADRDIVTDEPTERADAMADAVGEARGALCRLPELLAERDALAAYLDQMPRHQPDEPFSRTVIRWAAARDRSST